LPLRDAAVDPESNKQIEINGAAGIPAQADLPSRRTAATADYLPPDLDTAMTIWRLAAGLMPDRAAGVAA